MIFIKDMKKITDFLCLLLFVIGRLVFHSFCFDKSQSYGFFELVQINQGFTYRQILTIPQILADFYYALIYIEVIVRQQKHYISSMQFLTKDNEMMIPHLNQSVSIRRNIRIKSSKLPPDFFMTPFSQGDIPSPIISRKIGADISNRQIHTPYFQLRRRERSLKNQTIDCERKVETARASLKKIQNQDQLISVVLSTAQKLKRVVRKQSLDMKQNCKIDSEDRCQRLPKILRRAGQRI